MRSINDTDPDSTEEITEAVTNEKKSANGTVAAASASASTASTEINNNNNNNMSMGTLFHYANALQQEHQHSKAAGDADNACILLRHDNTNRGVAAAASTTNCTTSTTSGAAALLQTSHHHHQQLQSGVSCAGDLKRSYNNISAESGDCAPILHIAKQSRSRSYNNQWMLRFNELKRYKSEHGDCLVPQNYSENQQLANWVSAQRTQYRYLKEGKYSTMTNDRISMLDGLQFVWAASAVKMTQVKKNDEKWMEYFEQLKQYKGKHGDCDVKQKSSALGSWVHVQRCQFKLMRQGKRSALSNERIKLLQAVGFSWCIGKGPKGSVWEQRFAELKQYKAQHGNCLVPQKYAPNQPLANWVKQQRTHHRFLEQGKYSSLTDDRLTLLDSVGFVWKSKPRVENSQYSASSAISNKSDQEVSKPSKEDVDASATLSLLARQDDSDLLRSQTAFLSPAESDPLNELLYFSNFHDMKD